MFKEQKLVLLESNLVLLQICPKTHHMPKLDHSLWSEGHLQVLHIEYIEYNVLQYKFNVFNINSH